MSEIFLTQKVVFEADAIFYLPLVNEFVFLPVSNTNKLSSNATNITHYVTNYVTCTQMAPISLTSFEAREMSAHRLKIMLLA